MSAVHLQPGRAHAVRPAPDPIERALEGLLPPETTGDALAAAMRHAVLGPGKRVRARLALAAAHELGVADAAALPLACAVELLHAASLVVDDLPAMDDAALRRGRPATHCVHGEATAILAGIGLVARAFEVVAGVPELPGATRAAMVQALARAVGAQGLCAGQADDLQADAAGASLQGVQRMVRHKTGALFVAAVELAALAAGAAAERQARLREHAQHLALAFQIRDDLLDEAEDAGRCTHVSLLGRARAAALLQDHLVAARAPLRPGGPLDTLLSALFAAPLRPS